MFIRTGVASKKFRFVNNFCDFICYFYANFFSIRYFYAYLHFTVKCYTTVLQVLLHFAARVLIKCLQFLIQASTISWRQNGNLFSDLR